MRTAIRYGTVALTLIAGAAAAVWAGPAGRSQPSAALAEGAQALLARRCVSCHGPDSVARRAGLRLDRRDLAIAKLPSGRTAIQPGKPADSEVLKRISLKTSGVMPPHGAGKPLFPAEQRLLRDWISAGAPYQPHWSLRPLTRPALPKVRAGGWSRTPEDRFVLARLEQEKLSPSPPADRTTLIRRLTFDLTGLPPTPAEVKEFASDDSADSYERLVDRLLASPRFGERMAVDWLDAARYADTNGFQVDRDREMWPWRDWVIRSFNSNLPFDEFTVQQLAGDLLPSPTLDQRIATGFLRNHMLNEEGGIIPEEFLVEYVADRVETLGTIWLGMTVGCARCHDHKYDPVTQKEYYRLFAYFNSANEKGIGNYGAPPKLSAPPLLQLPTDEQRARFERLKLKVAAAEKSAAMAAAAQKAEVDKRLADARKELSTYELTIPTIMVMEELPAPRPTHILTRGQYDRPGEAVTPGTPECLPMGPAAATQNRLALAHWLTDRRNPLPARVAVNRFWQMLFGEGLVRTPDDFGIQGERPTHPELLEHLAWSFSAPKGESGVGLGWDVKALLKRLVLSATYRQSSAYRPELQDRDPENRLLARMSRVRLPAEMIRDNALAVSGLLKDQIGGPSVKPYHPPGLYEQVTATNTTYTQGGAEELYRRSMYTYWRRSVPHPAMLTFDAGFREKCSVRRSRTSTPLQALNLMNDPTYVDAAKALAKRMREEGGPTDAERITFAFRVVLAREPSAAEAAVLLRRLRTEPPPGPEGSAAAWERLAATLLNLDETIHRE